MSTFWNVMAVVGLFFTGFYVGLGILALGWILSGGHRRHLLDVDEDGLSAAERARQRWGA